MDLAPALIAGILLGLAASVILIIIELIWRKNDFFAIYIAGAVGVVVGGIPSELSWTEVVAMGIGFLLVGIPAFWWNRKRQSKHAK